MEFNSETLHKRYDEFVSKYPLSGLRTMPLERYTNGDKDSFIYDIEFGYTDLGNISGISALIHGIYYSPESQNVETDITLRQGHYVWKKLLGNSVEQAYDKIINAVADIAEAASKGNWQKVEENKIIYQLVKWKIAFLYSNKKLIPIYSKQMLEKAAYQAGVKNSYELKIYELQEKLIEARGDTDPFEFSNDLVLKVKSMSTVSYWTYSPGDKACMWKECVDKGIMMLSWDELGDYLEYKNKTDIKNAIKNTYTDASNNPFNNANAIWSFSHDMKIGDVVYAKDGVSKIVGRGVVTGEYYFDEEAKEYKSRRSVEWTHIGEWNSPFAPAIKTLTNITKYYEDVNKIEGLFNIDRIKDDSYGKNDFLNEVYMSEESYENIKGLLETKKNLILQGVPGVGKTFCAKRLCYSLIGKRDDSRICMVQFHQNYSYEDFVMGYKPAGNGFDLQSGIFYDFCQKAKSDPANNYYLIIDEINRGNLSKIFGELLMLIEKDYRGEKNAICLAYKKDELFYVPENLYLIGMMNTADRSLAMLDYALRRRFCFFTMKPAFDNDAFIEYSDSLSDERFDKVIEAVKRLNHTIAGDDSLGEGFLIGHSYFCNQTSVDAKWLDRVVKYEIEPMIREYWFDNKEKSDEECKKLETVLK